MDIYFKDFTLTKKKSYNSKVFIELMSKFLEKICHPEWLIPLEI